MLEGLNKAPWEPNSAYENRLTRLTVRGDAVRAVVQLHTTQTVGDSKITGDFSGQPRPMAHDLSMRDT